MTGDDGVLTYLQPSDERKEKPTRGAMPVPSLEPAPRVEPTPDPTLVFGTPGPSSPPRAPVLTNAADSGSTLVVGALRAVTPPPPAPLPGLPPPRPAPATGTVLKERYRLEERIGSGGTSVVYRATDLADLSPIAVKVMTFGAGDAQANARFQRELELTGGFHHPNVLRVFGLDSDDGIDFVTMELLTGDDLRSVVGRPLPLAAGLRIVTHAAAALEYIHSRGVHHRDVKPANLFQTTKGIIKLMDFGFAKGVGSTSMTMAGTIIGTPDYISPEQVTGEHPVGAAADLYSLGVLAYQLFTGTLPFRHAQLMQLLMMHVRDAPQPPRELNPEIPVELERTILRLLAKHPANRHAGATDLRKDLAKLWTLVGRAAATSASAPVPRPPAQRSS